MRIESDPPHDFYLTLDVDEYFEHEYDPLEIYRRGFARPLNLSTRDVLALLHWNEQPDDPVFDVEFPLHTLDDDERDEARGALRRVVGADLDVGAFHDEVRDDSTLGPVVEEHLGFKRLSRDHLFADAIRSIIRTRISHAPTRKQMVRDVRENWGQAFVYRDTTYYAYPRPEALVDADTEAFREYGVSRRKGEYIVGMAREIADGELDLDALESASPEDFYERLLEVRGIGPSTAQSLMLRRNRPDAYFPSHRSGGKEKGVRRWILQSYGLDPHDTDERRWQELRDRWRGYETLVSQYFFYDWVMRRKASADEE